MRHHPSPPPGHIHAHGGVLPLRVWVSCVTIARLSPLPPMCHTFTARQERQQWCPVQAARPSSTPLAHAQLSTTCHAPGNAMLRSRGGHLHSRCTRSSYLGVPRDSWGHLRVFSSTRLARSTPKRPPCGGNPCHAWDEGGLACRLGFVVLVYNWQHLLADRHSLPFPSLSLSEGPPSRCFGPPFLFLHGGGSRGGGGVYSNAPTMLPRPISKHGGEPQHPTF